MAALLQITEQDMQDLLGNQQAAEKLEANISGKAVELIQNKLDMQAFIYMSNFAKGVQHCGEIWLSMAKEVYVEEGRKMKGIGEQGEMSQVELVKPMIGEEGEVEVENDLSEAEFDVAVQVGPSSSSKRAATVRALTGMLQISDDPETKQVLSAMAMMNMEGEGITEVREYFRKKLLRLGVVEPTEEEKQTLIAETQNAKPDPQTMYLQAAAQEAEANAQRARADTVLTVAKAEETQAKTMKTVSEIGVMDQKQALEVIDRFGTPTPPPGPEVSVVAVEPPPQV
jgi:hypothetical protein